MIDDIAEFKVVSNADSVEYSGGLGGYINVVTKSGTNQYHGAVWEFLRNNDLDARNPFFLMVNPLKQNQFGFDVGGPVRLPHYNGRNRTFFFGSYQGFPPEPWEARPSTCCRQHRCTTEILPARRHL